jgi:hypothetical protein
MNPIRRLRRHASALAGLSGALLASAAAAPAAFAASPPPMPPLREKHPPLPVQVHTVAIGGMPGWQITLIAAAAALLAAVLAVIADRIRAARRRQIAGTA